MIVMITGTSGGIGSAIARLFLERGHEVYGIDIADSIIEHERYTHCIADVTDLDEVEAALPQGFRPEILINNAGVQESGKDIDIDTVGKVVAGMAF